MIEMHLFVQEGCRPCMYAETQLKKVEGWEKVVTITNAKNGIQWTQFATDCGIEDTPTLVALLEGIIIAKVTGSNNMRSDFWQATIQKHGENK